MQKPSSVFTVLGHTPAHEQVVAVLVKRCYALGGDRRLRRADVDLPIAIDAAHAERDDWPARELVVEPDFWPFKPLTDVVVKGRVHAPAGTAVASMRASVAVGEHAKVIQVLGDRHIEIGAGKRVSFSTPEAFESIELSYFRAYGGIDPEVTWPASDDVIDSLIAAGSHAGEYPRNPCGRAYIVSPGSPLANGRLLPNFEDPGNLLTPDRLFARDHAQWWKMPMPQGFGWFAPEWYPRSALAGAIPRLAPPDTSDDLEEVRRGWVPRGQSARVRASGVEGAFDFRLLNGASPGLALLPLRGDETVRLSGLAPTGDRMFDLPGQRPDVQIHFERRALDVEMSLHTVLIEPEEDRVSLVWAARARTPRSLPEHLPDEHGMRDDLLGFEIRVDGARHEHEAVPCV